MDKLALALPLVDVTVRFIGGPPIDEVVYWIRRCAALRAVPGPLTVVLQPRGEASSRQYEVRVESPERVMVTERDPNVLLAVRNAFDGLLAAQDDPTAAQPALRAHGIRDRRV